MFNLIGGLVVMLLLGSRLLLLTSDNAIIINLNLWELSKIDISLRLYLDFMATRFLLTVLLIALSVKFFRRYYLQGIILSAQFHTTLGVFILSMLTLIVRPNFITLMIGWDGLGISSYLLVIFYKRTKSLNAGLLTGISNRVGDGIILIVLSGFYRFPRIVLPIISNTKIRTGSLLLLILVVAACTKRAQLPFRAWLPAAMAAPTPVSALVHSSTLVTAGIYLLLRTSNLFYSSLSAGLSNLGGLTMILASLRALKETDAKKIVALSTLSQLGVIVTGFSFNNSRIIFFHLLVHAFFKALLFISTGYVIHNFNNYQNLRVMGGGVKWLTFNTSVIITTKARLAGLPFFAAFYSKEILLESLGRGITGSVVVYLWILLGVALTLLYSARFIFLTGHYYTRLQVGGYSSVKSQVLVVRMIILYVPSVAGGKYLLLYLNQYITLPLIRIIIKIGTLIIIIMAPFIYYLSRETNFSALKFYRFMWALPLFAGRVASKISGSLGLSVFKRIIFSLRDFYWFGWSKPISGTENLLILNSSKNLSTRLMYFILLRLRLILFLCVG